MLIITTELHFKIIDFQNVLEYIYICVCVCFVGVTGLLLFTNKKVFC